MNNAYAFECEISIESFDLVLVFYPQPNNLADHDVTENLFGLIGLYFKPRVEEVSDDHKFYHYFF